ncbi:unnamed protein product [Angiostrongylus costaricensis]|uniref:Uncharacterized protein n=1 Tax=Angiostrongylus costaricensis TaxID=334426 RepID=A0A0R3PFM2_ANGCS|nr:unnamed protein product [Angiostrongylus costaricensis]
MVFTAGAAQLVQIKVLARNPLSLKCETSSKAKDQSVTSPVTIKAVGVILNVDQFKTLKFLQEFTTHATGTAAGSHDNHCISAPLRCTCPHPPGSRATVQSAQAIPHPSYLSHSFTGHHTACHHPNPPGLARSYNTCHYSHCYLPRNFNRFNHPAFGGGAHKTSALSTPSQTSASCPSVYYPPQFARAQMIHSDQNNGNIDGRIRRICRIQSYSTSTVLSVIIRRLENTIMSPVLLFGLHAKENTKFVIQLFISATRRLSLRFRTSDPLRQEADLGLNYVFGVFDTV